MFALSAQTGVRVILEQARDLLVLAVGETPACERLVLVDPADHVLAVLDRARVRAHARGREADLVRGFELSASGFGRRVATEPDREHEAREREAEGENERGSRAHATR